VLTEPIEEGSFTTYNKIADPVEVGVTLLSQASFDEQAAILEKLKAYARDPVKLILVTPEAAYDSLTLESYSYSRTREAGATLLAVDLTLKEVREVETNVTTEATAPPISQDNAKNPGSTTKKSTGKAGTKEVKEPEKNRSALRKTTGREL
jgi:hypothetical protein